MSSNPVPSYALVVQPRVSSWDICWGRTAQLVAGSLDPWPQPGKCKQLCHSPTPSLKPACSHRQGTPLLYCWSLLYTIKPFSHHPSEVLSATLSSRFTKARVCMQFTQGKLLDDLVVFRMDDPEFHRTTATRKTALIRHHSEGTV